MNFADTLENHFLLCQEIHQLLLEESRLMQSTQRPADEHFLAVKRSLLPRLDYSLQALRALAPSVPTQAPQHAEAIQRAQQKVLTLLLLDRENEKLLLKFSMGATSRPSPTRAPLNAVRNAYARAAA